MLQASACCRLSFCLRVCWLGCEAAHLTIGGGQKAACKQQTGVSFLSGSAPVSGKTSIARHCRVSELHNLELLSQHILILAATLVTQLIGHDFAWLPLAKAGARQINNNLEHWGQRPRQSLSSPTPRWTLNLSCCGPAAEP